MGVYSGDGMLEKGTTINFAVVNKLGKMWDFLVERVQTKNAKMTGGFCSNRYISIALDRDYPILCTGRPKNYLLTKKLRNKI